MASATAVATTTCLDQTHKCQTRIQILPEDQYAARGVKFVKGLLCFCFRLLPSLLHRMYERLIYVLQQTGLSHQQGHY